MKKELNAYEKIKKAQKEMEQWIIKRIKEEGSYYPFLGSNRIWNAIARLKKTGKIKLCKGKYTCSYKLS